MGDNVGKASVATAGHVFARESTGLVREVSAIDSAIAGAANVALGQFIVFAMPLAFGVFAGVWSGSILVAIGIAAIFTVPTLLNYATLTAAMPRSGGDYVFTTRILHPAVGFGTNFALALWQLIAAGAYALLAVEGIISPALTILGAITKSSTLSDWGTAVTTPVWRTTLALAFIVVVTLLLCLGTQLTLRINSIFWLIGMASLTLLIFILAFTPQHEFVTRFNDFAGKPDAYNQVIRDAASAGFSTGSPLVIWPLVALAMSVFGAFFWATYWAGELKMARSWRREAAIMFSPLIVQTVYAFAVTALMIYTFGYKFLASACYLSLVAPDKLVAGSAAGPPVFFTGLAAGNNLVAALFVLTFLAWTFILLVMLMIMPIRCVLAWSLDQVFPSALMAVNRRFHTPVRITVGIGVIAIAIVVIAEQFPTQLFSVFAASVLSTVLYSSGISSIDAVVFPWRMPEMYKQQPVSKYRLFGIPILAISGVVSFVYTIGWLAAYVGFSTQFGMTLPLATIVLSPALVGLVIYYVARAIRTSQGIPMELAFREVPPE